MSEKDIKVNTTNYGMDLDSLPQYIKEGDTSFAMNANIQSNESSLYTYTNEPSNILCNSLPTGYVVISSIYIKETNRIIYFLVNPLEGKSEIGYIIPISNFDSSIIHEPLDEEFECKDCGGDVYKSNYPVVTLRPGNNCVYQPILNASCLNFSINHPIKVVYKSLECGIVLFFVDGVNPDRYLNLNKLPFKELEDASCLPIYTSDIDCNKMNVYPDVDVPIITATDVLETGSLEWGSYQFAITYATNTGESISKYFGLTNIVPIIDLNKIELNFGQNSNKSIRLNISKLEDVIYEYFNLYVIKTVRNTTSLELVDTYTTKTTDIVYTGNNKTQINIPVQELFKDYPYYTSNLITTSNGYLMKGDLKSSQLVNWQKAVNEIELKWITYKQKYKDVSYKNPINTTNFRTYQRDEVVPFGIFFTKKNGETTNVFTLISRNKKQTDIDDIFVSNQDNLNLGDDCSTQANKTKPRWQVYNTANITKTYENNDVYCESTPHQEGEFAYWESTSKYPCDKEVWGDLADKPIRHFKFPDNSISHIHDSVNNITLDPKSNYYKDNYIYPIGVKIDPASLDRALKLIPLEERNSIQSYTIVRGNRVNNKSVIAKGLLYNVGMYDEYDEFNKKKNTYYYPNYPFNDLRKDPFVYKDASIYTTDQPKIDKTYYLDGFSSSKSKERFTFHSPDTHFYNPGLGNYLKLETEEFGFCRTVVKEVENHAKYKFLTLKDHTLVALPIAAMIAVFWTVSAPFGGGGNPVPIALETYKVVIDIIRYSVPYRNYCYQINSVGNYNSFIKLSDNGFRQRGLGLASYLVGDGFQYTGDDLTINQYHRESSVYLKTIGDLPLPVTQDVSRQHPVESETYSNISSFYGSIKRFMPDQYSTIDSVEWLETGNTGLINNGRAIYIPDIFGGDTFITKFALKRKLRYFNDSRVDFPNEADIDYELTRNLGQPIYYFNTTPPTVDDGFKDPGGAGAITTFIKNLGDLSKMFLKLPKANFDNHSGFFSQKGRIYLYNYGIPFFFVESDVNTEYRFFENDSDKDFYPHTAPELDIPNRWLQERITPIYFDNTYIYNKDYSKQIKEQSHTILPESYKNQICRSVHHNRVIYSEPSKDDEVSDKWLIFKANNFYDFPRENGALKILKGIENTKVLCVFENTFSIYNAFVTIQTTTKDALVGNGGMFATPPLEYSKSEVGYGGTSNSTVLSSNFGTYWIDSERTKVYQLRDGLVEISDAKYKIERWLNDNLQFKIKEKFPSVYTDNPYKGIGFSMGWDEKNSRLFITKLDYTPLKDTIAYNETSMEFYDTANGSPVDLLNPTYFCNKSFTVAFKVDVQRWVSFYSFTPNFYTSLPNFFQTGVRGKGVWNHLVSNRFYQTFYNELHPYVLEIAVSNGLNTSILQSLHYSQDIKEYYNDYDYYTIPDGGINFNKAYIYNSTQSTGILNLIKQPKNNLNSYMTYPVLKPDSKDILYNYYENKFSFNTFWDINKNYRNRQPIHTDSCTTLYDKVLNPLFHDYSLRSHDKNRMRGEWFKIRLINDKYNRYKFSNNFDYTYNHPSY